MVRYLEDDGGIPIGSLGVLCACSVFNLPTEKKAIKRSNNVYQEKCLDVVFYQKLLR